MFFISERIESELGNILTRAKGELKEDGEYDKLHQLWQMLKSE